MTEGSEQVDQRGRGSPRVRLEATVHPGERRSPLEGVAALDLDRVPDPEGGVRVLVTPEEAVLLVEAGFEVHLLRAVPVAPLDPNLVMSDDEAQAWLEAQVAGIERERGE